MVDGSKKGTPKRWVIAHDETGYYVRETLCVTHHGETGEAQYDTRPVPGGGGFRSLKAAVKAARGFEHG